MKLFLVTFCVIGIVACANAQIFGRGEPRGHGQMVYFSEIVNMEKVESFFLRKK